MNRGRFSAIFPKRMISFTKKAMKKHDAHGYGKEHFAYNPNGKDWKKREVVKAIDYLIERNIFDNPIVERKRIVGFLKNTAELIDEYQVSEPRKEMIRKQTELFLDSLLKEKKPNDAVQFFNALGMVFSSAEERMQNIATNLLTSDYGGKRPKNNKEALARYYRLNARDAFSHRLAYFQVLGLIMDEVINVLRNRSSK
jgi:hypothetical protein